MDQDKLGRVTTAIAKILKYAGEATKEIEPAFNELKDLLFPASVTPKKKVPKNKKKKSQQIYYIIIMYKKFYKAGTRDRKWALDEVKDFFIMDDKEFAKKYDISPVLARKIRNLNSIYRKSKNKGRRP